MTVPRFNCRHGSIVDQALVAVIILLIVILCLDLLWDYLPPRAGVQHEMFFDGGKDKTSMSYLLFLPQDYYDDQQPWPLILFLHGAGHRGDDLKPVRNCGLPEYMKTQRDFPFIVLSPQCPAEYDWEPDSLIALLDEVVSKYRVDKDRIYATGLSMGGFGTWALAAAYPERFAAIVPICGGGDPGKAERLKHLSIWVFHGAKDETVPVSNSEEMVDALKAVGANIKLTVYPDAGHDSWTETYANKTLYQWLLEQKHNPGL